MDRARISGVCCHVSSKPVVSSAAPWKICRFFKIPAKFNTSCIFPLCLVEGTLISKKKLAGKVLIGFEKPCTRIFGGEWCPAEPDCTASCLQAAEQGAQECCNTILMSFILKHSEYATPQTYNQIGELYKNASTGVYLLYMFQF